ncbi:MAG: chemotaxis protein CheX [Lachnospiraceae bacterium]|nr:chemotaxis protein CheX [Lachnospiraceae bacterium]
MYAQFFGSYLLNKNAVSAEHLTTAIAALSETHIKLGTLAMHKGYMTASEVDEVCFLQTREDKRFGEIALERNYLFEDQLEDLLKSQNPDYLLLGQTLVDMGVLSNTELESLMIGYQEDNKLDESPEQEANIEETTALITHFFENSGRDLTGHTLMYMNLVFNNLVRFIGEDFTPLAPVSCTEYNTTYCVTQAISGPVTLTSGVDMEPDVAMAFASRYAKMEFNEFDEYVSASLEDFLNLHNGLFSVNMSNMYSEEIELQPPMHEESPVITMSEDSFVMPVIYPFGTVYLLIII